MVTLKAAIDKNTGCLSCLDSCPVGVISNETYTYGAIEKRKEVSSLVTQMYYLKMVLTLQLSTVSKNNSFRINIVGVSILYTPTTCLNKNK